MEDRTITLKQLYQYVDEYFVEARTEGFETSAGDFVDWIASQDTDPSTAATSLPEKISELPTCKVPAEMVKQEKDVQLLLAEGGGQLAEAVNGIIDYLKDKDR